MVDWCCYRPFIFIFVLSQSGCRLCLTEAPQDLLPWLPYHHEKTQKQPWYANARTDATKVSARLDVLAPLYDQVSGHGFGNLTGDALEIVTFKCLHAVQQENPRYAFLGHFHLNQPKTQDGRYRKTQPPKVLGGASTAKEADFIQFGHDPGALCIECKNYRAWLYPHASAVAELIIKAYELQAAPVLIARRLHYTTRTNLLEPAGIIAHETYNNYYPIDQGALAAQVSDKRSLGFTDVLATEDPQPRTLKFFREILPRIATTMAARWLTNRDALYDYARGNLNLAQLYTEIGSPAGGKWQTYEDLEPQGFPDPADQ